MTMNISLKNSRTARCVRRGVFVVNDNDNENENSR